VKVPGVSGVGVGCGGSIVSGVRSGIRLGGVGIGIVGRASYRQTLCVTIISRNMIMFLLYRAVLRKLFSSAAHPNLSKTRDGTPQNFASRKEGTKLYMAIHMYLHINPCPIRMQAYENKTKCMLNKTIDDEPVCVCVTNDKILPIF
jgi:hypothetical protein